MRIAITGATGMIGSALTRFLTVNGHEVLPLVRRRDGAPAHAIFWNPARGEIDTGALEGMDAVINLAGKNIGSSLWTKKHLAEVRASRIEGTKLLAGTLASLRNPPKVLISASAIGYYGASETVIFTEASPSPQNDVLSQLCLEWEEAAIPARQRGIRVVHPRFGLVLSAAGAPLKLMLPVFKVGLGGTLGSGKQWMSWIALEDLVNAIYWLITSDLITGPVNLTSPKSITNQEFTHTLANILRRPAILSVPSVVLEATLGRMADELLLKGARVYPSRLLESGFVIKYPDLESCLRKELGMLEKGTNSP